MFLFRRVIGVIQNEIDSFNFIAFDNIPIATYTCTSCLSLGKVGQKDHQNT